MERIELVSGVTKTVTIRSAPSLSAVSGSALTRTLPTGSHITKSVEMASTLDAGVTV